VQHAATRCNTLQHAATRCNTLQHAVTRCAAAEAQDLHQFFSRIDVRMKTNVCGCVDQWVGRLMIGCVCVCVSVCMYVCMYVYIHIDRYIYIDR